MSNLPLKRVFICSPYSGNVEKNVHVAKHLCKMAAQNGDAPFAPHLLYPQFLIDSVEEQRKIGIECSMSFLAMCNEIWVYAVDGISAGMKAEIEHASALNIPIHIINERNFPDKIKVE